MTLKEIAKEAGVSISTVSRVINKNSTNAASKEVPDLGDCEAHGIYAQQHGPRFEDGRHRFSRTALPLDCLSLCPDGGFQIGSFLLHAGTQY